MAVKRFKKTFELYNDYEVKLIIADEYAELEKLNFEKGAKLSHFVRELHACTLTNDEKHFCMIVLNSNIRDIKTIAHESFHAAMALFERIGENAHNAEESFAYLLGTITQFVYDSVNKKK